MPTSTSAKMKELADSYGYQLAFLRSDKELYSVFTKAVAGSWDANRFVAAVRATKWYKTHSETWRTNQQLKFTDPATWKAKQAQAIAQVNRLVGEMGATLSTAGRGNIAAAVMNLGWDDNQVRAALSKYIVGQDAESRTGLSEQVSTALRQTAYRNGVNISEGYINTWAQRVARGEATVEDAQQQLRSHYGKTVAPGFAKELEAGQDLYDLASPYMQSMSKTLELNPADVDLFDPTIRKALSGAGAAANGDGSGGTVPLWQFERDLKKDPRWTQTNGARDQLDAAARNLGQMFGVSA